MTATANLTALHTAALAGDRVAMLLLADVAEDQGEDDRADAWRWLADPPSGGWERRAAELVGLAGVCGLAVVANGGWVKGRGPVGRDGGPLTFPARLWCRRASIRCTHLWDESRGWRFVPDGQPAVACHCPPGVREAVLSACRLALAGVSS